MTRCRRFRTVDVNVLKLYYIFVILYWKICERSITTGYYLDTGKIGEPLSNIWPELNLPNAYIGQFYQAYIASENLKDYHIRFLVSKVGSQELPRWLKYEDKNFSLTGIPLASDVGLHQLFVLAMDCNETDSVLLGAQNFEVHVLSNTSRVYCDRGVNFVATELSLAVNGTSLNSTQRLELYEWFVTEFNHSNSVYFKHELKAVKRNVTGCDIFDEYETHANYTGPVLTISWLVGCRLTNVSETMSKKLGTTILHYSVLYWRILKGNDSILCTLDVPKSSDVSSVLPSMLVTPLSPTVTMFGNSTHLAQHVPSSPIVSLISTSMSLNPSFHSSQILNGSFTSVLERKSRFNSVYNISMFTGINSVLDQNFSTKLREISSATTNNVPTITQSITQNSDPVVRRPLPTLNITSCQYLYYEIPQDTFWDKEDGYNLTLRLLTKNFREPWMDSWIQLHPTRDVIQGVLVSSTIFGKNSTRADFEFVLSAVDSEGRSANTTMSLSIFDDFRPVGQEISIEVKVQSNPFNPTSLLQDISEYLYNGDQKTMKILSLNQTSQKVYLTWSDCRAVTDVCDVKRVERISKLIRINGNFLNPHFVIALVPDFVLLNADIKKQGECLNEPPLAGKNNIYLNVTCCGVFSYQIPNDLFYDKEDGDTRNLSLSIRFSSSSRPSSERWVALNETTQTLEGVVILEYAQSQPNFDEFFIVGQDSGRLEANVSVVVTVQRPLPVTNYHVSLFLKPLLSISNSLEEVFIIIEKLSSYFHGKSSDDILVLSYSRENTVTVFTWSVADLRFKPCDTVAIANISKKLKATDGQVNDDFKSSMLPDFQVQFIFEERLGHCKEGSNEEPVVVIPSHQLRLNLTYFEYKIPASTFSDLEDGNTRNLKLSLLLPSYDLLPLCSWIVLDSEDQVIYGLPDEAAIQTQPSDGYRYLLVGQDSGGKIASSNVRVLLPETSHPYNYQITAQLRSYLHASLPCVDHVVEFLKKLSTLIGEEKERIQIISYNISKDYPADVTISWTNRSASFNTCDHEIIKERFNVFSSEAGVTRSFSEILLPYFIVENVKLELLETCMFPNTPPVLLSPVETLNIPIYQALRFLLPPRMFYDAQDGFTRNLTVVALDNNRRPLNSSSWIQFNSTAQVLYGLPTSTVAREQPVGGYVIHFFAMDIQSEIVNATTRIMIENPGAMVNFEVEISVTVNSSRKYSEFHLVSYFLSKVETYLSIKDTIVTNYFKVNTTLSVSISTKNFVGSECNLVELHEFSDNLLSKNIKNVSEFAEDKSNSTHHRLYTQPNENFTQAMLPEFLISNVTEHKTGPCSNTAPFILHPIPHFIISSHGLFFITIPPKTFDDKEDGFTSNLSLTLLSSSGDVLPPNSWLKLNDTADELYGIFMDEINTNVNYTFFLKAEDRYGFNVNTSFTVEVTARFQNVGFKVNMIFKSNFSSIIPYVDIIKLLVTKMTSYYHDNFTLLVLSFERGSGLPSTDILSWSVSGFDTENCDLQKLHEISKKTRLSNNQPNEELKNVLFPEFELLVVFEQRLGSCADKLNSNPTVTTPVLNLNITTIPAVFSYTVPRNVFYDPEDGNTRNLTLVLLSEDGKEIPRNSSVQFNSPLQIVYGILTEKDLDTSSRITKREIGSKTMKFILFAMDSGGETVSVFLEIILGNNIISQDYELHLNFISYLSSTSPDVIHLINFQEKLRGIETLRDMQVANYVRTPGYPAEFQVSFVNSTSNNNKSLCDFTEISGITQTFQDSSSNLRNEFTVRFLPEFVIQKSNVQRFGPCETLPNHRPKVNRLIPLINITVCEVLKFKIAEDIFLDEDGNTRNLTLKLEHILPQKHKIYWIFFDVVSQIIYAVPSLKVIEDQPETGYLFKLIAVDSQGEKAELNINILVRDTVIKDSYRLTVIVRVPSSIITKEDLVLKTVEFIETTKQYLSSSVSANNLRVINFTKISQSLLKVTWSNCTFRYTPCEYQDIEKIRQAMIFTGTLPQPRFIQSLAPEFIVDSVEDELSGPCLNKRPVVMRQLKPLNLTLCNGLFHYFIPSDTFFDAEDGFTSNLTLSISTSDSIPLSKNYWISIDKSQIIVAYPNVDAVKSQPKSGYEFLLNAKDSHGMSTNAAMKVRYEKQTILQSSYEVTFVLEAQFANFTSSVDQMQVILQKLVGYMGGSEQLIRVHSFVHTSVNSTTSYLTWSNCTFISSGCDLLGIVETSKKLKNNNGEISEQLREEFRPDFELKFVFDQRLGACVGATNVRPKVKHTLYQITIESLCGFWQFVIPSDFFHDEEDGGTRNLTLSFKTVNSKEVVSDSWIQLDQETQTLYGFPSPSNSSNSSSANTNELFILIAADSQGKFATMKLEVIFGKQMTTVHYTVLVEMTSFIGKSFPDVYHLKFFVDRLSSFLKTETKSILVTNYVKIAAGPTLKLAVSWTNCSVAVNSCDSNQISILRGKLNLIAGQVDKTFSQSMLPYFVPNSVILEKQGLCRIEAMKSPPQLVMPIGRIFAYSGSLLRYSIPAGIFIDEEDGNALNLSLVLQFSSEVSVPSSYWLKFDNSSLLISGVLLVENSWKRSFRVLARDQHGNEAVDIFEVFLQERCPEKLLSYKIFTELRYTRNKESLNTEFLRKLTGYFEPRFSDTNFTLLSITAKVNNTFLIVWSHVKTCDVCLKANDTIQALSENITQNGTVLSALKTSLLPQFVIMNISEEKCTVAPGVPRTIIKGGKDDRWKFYVVPIVVLLIFLLFSFIFFLCRGFVYPYESKKEEVILDESPVSEINVTERVSRRDASMYNNSASTTIINEGYLGNTDAISLPEIFLDKRVSPSKSSLHKDLSPTSAQDVEPAVAPTPPLYTDAVLHLAAQPNRKPRESQTSSPTTEEKPIEMREIPIIKTEVAQSSEAIPVSKKSELDARLSYEFIPLSEVSEVDGRPSEDDKRIQVTRNPSLYSKPDDTLDGFDYEEDSIPVRNHLRLPTPPEIGLLWLPPVPQPLNNTTPSSLVNSPPSRFVNTPNSPPSSAYSTPILTPNYSRTTVNNTYNVRQVHTPSEIPQNNYPHPPAYSEYPYGTPMRDRTELGMQSPISYGTPVRVRTQLGIQSPLGFPFSQSRVPYVDHRQQGPPVQSRPSDLHEVLGQLRETVNRELDRRNEVDKYLDTYLTKK